MKLLILGGTQFAGLHFVRMALAARHEITLCNRGKSGAGMFPDVETLIGDRNGSLDVLRGRSWDAVVDMSGYTPDQVRTSARILADSVELYVYISTVMVYADYGVPMQDEAAPLAEPAGVPIRTGSAYTYGFLKAQCEHVLASAVPGRVLTIRPGFIVGPYDYTDRFTSLVRRVRRGGEMLAPGSPDDPLQFIDARDLATFILSRIEAGRATAYNATGPGKPLSWGILLDGCKGFLKSDARFTWVNAEFLRAQGLAGWNLPLWVPPEDRGLMSCDCRKAVTAGLTFRPLEETVHDTLAWHDVSGTETAGLPPEQETALLRAWKETRGREYHESEE